MASLPVQLRAALLFALFQAACSDPSQPQHVAPSCEVECERDGLCEPVGEFDSTCVATSAQDCEASFNCTRWGRCSFVDGACVVDAAGCAASEVCTRYGSCGVDESGQACVPRSADDCQASLECGRTGSCELSPEAERTIVCKDYDFCTVVTPSCVTSDAYCEASAECASEGRCVGGDIECVE